MDEPRHEAGPDTTDAGRPASRLPWPASEDSAKVVAATFLREPDEKPDNFPSPLSMETEGLAPPTAAAPEGEQMPPLTTGSDEIPRSPSEEVSPASPMTRDEESDTALRLAPPEVEAVDASLPDFPAPDSPPENDSTRAGARPLPSGKAPSPFLASNTHFAAAAVILGFALLLQATFHFRSQLAVGAPFLRPALLAMSEALDTTLPLPAASELVSIEDSDLQADPKRSELLLLQAVLRNRASYPQQYPLLELTLTDLQDSPIARKIFRADAYLPPGMESTEAFAASGEVPIRLWIKAQELAPAGYRLYVFHP